MRLAEAETYRPLWSDQVLGEVERNLPKLGVSPENARHRIAVMRERFPDALVTGYESLIDSMTNHPKDRHVLAAAVRANAEILVTSNIKDFPRKRATPMTSESFLPMSFFLINSISTRIKP